jgi:hypothetical protein
LWFRVSPPPHRENASGNLYIGFLGQPHQPEIKTDDIGAMMTDVWRVVDDDYGQVVGKLKAESMMSTAASIFPQ